MAARCPCVADARFEALLEEAIAALPASATALRIRLRAVLGVYLYYVDEVERGETLLADAVQAARETGDPITLGRALMSYRFCGGPFEADQRIRCGHELIELGERTGQEIFSLVGCEQLCWCHRELGDRAEMDRWRAAAAQIARGPDIEQLSQTAGAALLDGDLDRAQQITDDIARIEGERRSYTTGMRRLINNCRGRLTDRARLHARMDSHPSDRWLIEALLARTLARTRRTSDAVPLLDAARARSYVPRRSQTWTMAMGCLADAAALCGHRAVAGDVIDLLGPLAGQWIDPGQGVWDTVDRVRALSVLTLGDASTAHDIAERAAATSRRQATPILLGRELIVLAAATAQLGGSPTEHVNEALTIADRTGARVINHDARLLVPTASSHDDPTGLSRREREIVNRVALGETNRQIAHALHIAEATVRKHLEHAFRTLDVSTRTAAVNRVATLNQPQWNPETHHRRPGPASS